YLDLEMGLVPHTVAIAELEADEEIKNELRSKIDLWLRGEHSSPIESVDLFESGDERRLVLNREEGNLIVETSLKHRWTRIDPRPSAAK
ncbi:MAG TPA: hypothetical protein VJ656_12140, partial [Pyrinomonadaceae bacterium]|nr:hypothetical protein [Pyrinomonadaceae bacterium]